VPLAWAVSKMAPLRDGREDLLAIAGRSAWPARRAAAQSAAGRRGPRSGRAVRWRQTRWPVIAARRRAFEPADQACDDGNVCTANSTCDGAGVCTVVGLLDMVPCDDRNACTTADTCVAAVRGPRGGGGASPASDIGRSLNFAGLSRRPAPRPDDERHQLGVAP